MQWFPTEYFFFFFGKETIFSLGKEIQNNKVTSFIAQVEIFKVQNEQGLRIRVKQTHRDLFQ